MIENVCIAALMSFVHAMTRQLVFNGLLAAMEHVNFSNDAVEG